MIVVILNNDGNSFEKYSFNSVVNKSILKNEIIKTQSF